MYETLDHWKQYKIAKEFKLNEAIKEMDKFLNKLITKNGATKL